MDCTLLSLLIGVPKYMEYKLLTLLIGVNCYIWAEIYYQY